MYGRTPERTGPAKKFFFLAAALFSSPILFLDILIMLVANNTVFRQNKNLDTHQVTTGPRLLRISVVRFSLVHIFQK